MNWQADQLHNPAACYLCKTQPSSTCHNERLYWVVGRSGMYKVQYQSFDIPVPVCPNCGGHLASTSRNVTLLLMFSWAISSAIVAYLLPFEWSEAIDEMVLPILFAMGIGYVTRTYIARPIAFVWDRLAPNRTFKSSPTDYPVISYLISEGWQTQLPDPKYGPFDSLTRASRGLTPMSEFPEDRLRDLTSSYVQQSIEYFRTTRHSVH